jgi:transcriptional regulator with PAS, ATPase and Fis domain
MKNEENAWVKSFPGAITITDTEGIILEMNDKSAIVFEEDGGRDLIGTNMLACHPGASRQQVEKMLQTRETNVYTIEKKGKKKIIYQTPWFKDGVYAGYIEMALEIPFDMDHFLRD